MNKRTIAAVTLALALVPAAALAAGTNANRVHAVHAAPVKVAPADEYFGRMKMSILGITNSIRDTGMREGFDPPNAGKYYASLSLTEDALEDWATKYPQDSWIPRRAYDLSHDFWRIHTPDADAQAQRCRAILFSHFPRNHWAVIARHETPATVAPVAAVPAAVDSSAKQQQQP